MKLNGDLGGRNEIIDTEVKTTVESFTRDPSHLADW